MVTQLTPVNVTDNNYGVIAKYYILCTEARDFDKSKVATGVFCKTIFRLNSSRSPFFSMPEKLAAILEDIYRQTAVPVMD